MPVIVAVAIFGAVGTASRYAVDRLIEQHTESLFPWSTFVINVTGCLLFGLVTAALVDRHHLPGWFRVGLVVGFVGGYTTFSTYAAEALDLGEGRAATLALAYATGSVVVGIAAVFTGAKLGRML